MFSSYAVVTFSIIEEEKYVRHEDHVQRVLSIANHIVEHRGTLRSTARAFGVSKNTVFRDIHYRLSAIDEHLAKQALSIIEENKNTRHIRGGNATKAKYRTNDCHQNDPPK